MYKVFFNGRIITLESGAPSTMNNPEIQSFEIINQEQLPEIVNHFLMSDKNEVHLYNKNLPELWASFKSCFILIKAAGGFVLKEDKFLFIFRQGKWDLPKGKIDKGESPSRAALREVEEECGISNVKINKQLPSTFHIYQSPYPDSKDQWILKETFWFEMEYKGNQILKPQTSEDITSAEWVGISDFDKILKNTYPNIEDIVKSFRLD